MNCRLLPARFTLPQLCPLVASDCLASSLQAGAGGEERGVYSPPGAPHHPLGAAAGC